jgi:hypothetical protein
MLLVGSRMHSPLEQNEMPDEVSDVLAEIAAPPATTLDERLWKLLNEVASPELRERIAAKGIVELSDAERTTLAIALMRRYNKVTHIYELVKAYGTTSQVEFERPEKIWRRRENITAKHDHELAVNIFDGRKQTGEGHAPLLYADDPRTDIPAALQKYLQEVIKDRDAMIVAGWLRDSWTRNGEIHA